MLEVGENVGHIKVGMKVAFSDSASNPRYHGSYRQETIVPGTSAIPFPDEVAYDQICSALINPLTICGFIDIV